MMNKKIVPLLCAALLLAGCVKDYTDTVDPKPASVSVVALTPVTSFSRTPEDTLLRVTLQLSAATGVATVKADVFNSLNNKVTALTLLDNGIAANGDVTAGDKVYSAFTKMLQSYPNGEYRIEYGVYLDNGGYFKAGSQSFRYDNGKANIAPVLSAVTAPDTVTVRDTSLILITVTAADSNGLSDIETVYFISTRPDGTSNNIQFQLKDDGNRAASGDVTAGDGVYSIIVQVTSTAQKGAYRFDFRAKDRGKLNSNLLSHTIRIL